MNDVHPLLEGFRVVTTIPILWGDEDAFRHVNNVVYLRWCESARVEYLQRIGLWTELPPQGTGPIVASIKCDYKAQLKYPDTVLIGTRVASIGNSSIRVEHVVVGRDQNVVAATVDSTLVNYDYAGQRPVPVPEHMRETIGRVEGKSFAALNTSVTR